MSEVVETLPWGIIEYDEEDDEIWFGYDLIQDERPDLPKSITIPDLHDRKYSNKRDDFDFPRNIAQIVYEETSCVLPRDLHIYDCRARELSGYGIKGTFGPFKLVGGLAKGHPTETEIAAAVTFYQRL